MTVEYSRRDCVNLALCAGFLGATALPFSSCAQTARASGLQFASAAESLEALVRILGDSAGKLAPWWYTGTIYGVQLNEAPRPLVRFEGSEINLFVRHSPASFRQTGSTTTFFQDFTTGEALEEFRNPYTQQRNRVRANKLGGTGGFVEWSSDGVEPFWGGRASGKQPLHISWTTLGARVWMRHDRVFPAQLPQPIYEASTSRADKRQLLNRRLTSCPAEFSSTYIARWPAWMDMGDLPGHVIWHADGIKLPTVDALPSQYLRRLRSEFPEQLSIAPPPS